MRDITLEDTFYLDFTTRAFATGVPTVLAGTPVLSVLEENNATPITSGVSVSVDRASVVGLNMATIVATAANGYEKGKGYSLYISTGTVGGVSVVGEKVGEFTIGKIANNVWDEVLTGATHNVINSAGRRLRQIQEAGGYSGGRVYLDTVNGADSETSFEDGVDSNATSTIAHVNVILAALGLTTVHVASGSTVTLGAAQNNQVFMGSNWTLDLNGQDIAGSHFIGATVSGVAAGTGTTQIFENCIMNATSHIKGTHMLGCGIAATQTVIEAGDFFFDRCHSGIAGMGTWTFNFGGAIGNTNLNVRMTSGGTTLEAMGDTGTDVGTFEGFGQIIEGTCAGGTVEVRGHFPLSGVTNITFNDDARYDVAQILAQINAGLNAAIPGSPTADSINQRMVAIDDLIQASGAGDLAANLINTARLTAARAQVLTDWINGGRLDLLLDAVKAVTDVQAALTISGTCSGTPTTTTTVSDITVTVDDQFNGRVITFKKDTTTVALRGQQTDITGSTAATNTLTFTQIATAPVSGDTFDIT